MRTINLAEAKARLSELVEQSGKGETIQIARRGRPIAQLTPVSRPRKPIEARELRRVTDGMPVQTESAGEFMRRLRDTDRY